MNTASFYLFIFLLNSSDVILHWLYQGDLPYQVNIRIFLRPISGRILVETVLTADS